MESGFCTAISLGINCFTFAALVTNIRNEIAPQTPGSPAALPTGSQSKSWNLLLLLDQLFLGCSPRRWLTANMSILRNRMVFVAIIASSIGAVDPLGDRGIFSVGQVYILGAVQMWFFFIVFCHYFGSWMLFLILLRTHDKNRSFGIKNITMGILISLNLIFVTLEVVGLNAFVNTSICPILYRLYLFSSLGICTSFLITSSIAASLSVKSLKECQVQGKQSGNSVVDTIYRKQFLISCLFFSGIVIALSNAIFDLPTTTCRGEFKPKWVFFLFQVSITSCWPVLLMFNWIWNRMSEAPGKSTEKTPIPGGEPQAQGP